MIPGQVMENKKSFSMNRRSRDIIVIGASAGGVEALVRLVRDLPADLPAAIFIVIHLPPYPPSSLPDLLSRSGPLPAAHAVHGELIRPGRIYVAPPDSHLMVNKGYVRVVRGPKENGHRPAVDPLFRTAARAYGVRVVGVVLTGALDCGTIGLLTVKALGGLAIVQEPREAFCPDMPRSAIEHVKVDYILPLSQIAPVLARLTGEPVRESRLMKKNRAEKPEKPVADITCPECNGALTEREIEGMPQFSCHVGHAFSMDGMFVEQAETLEAALWSAVRALEESEALAQRMAVRSDPGLSGRFREKAETMRHHAEVIQKILLGGNDIRTIDTVRRKRKPAAKVSSKRPRKREAEAAGS